MSKVASVTSMAFRIFSIALLFGTNTYSDEFSSDDRWFFPFLRLIRNLRVFFFNFTWFLMILPNKMLRHSSTGIAPKPDWFG
jgi:hypothetical protein